jgi:hypothetical protein
LNNKNYLKNLSTGVYDLNLNNIALAKILGYICIGHFSSRQYAIVNTSTGLINSTTTVTGITINLWLYFEGSITSCDIFEFYNTSDATTEMEFQIDRGKLFFYFNYGAGTYVDFGSPVLNNWVMFTLTFDGVSYITYRNSTLVYSGTANGTSLANFVNINRNSLSFGNSIFNNGGIKGSNNASIADFRMYNSVLTQNEITTIYRASTG